MRTAFRCGPKNLPTTGVCSQHRGLHLRLLPIAGVCEQSLGVSCSILAKAKSQLKQEYLSRRLKDKAAKQPRYLNANIGEVLGGCPRVHHIPCTSARGCLFPSYYFTCITKMPPAPSNMDGFWILKILLVA